MVGMQYAGRLGGQYGSAAFGGQYGPRHRGRRLDLTPPGTSTPDRRLDAIISIEIAPEHTAISEMTVELPPIDGIDADSYVGGEMAYHVDDRLIFAVEIDDLSIADDYTITLTGTAVEDGPLDHDQYDVSYGRMLTADAIDDFLSRLPYESVVHPTPTRLLSDRVVQTASEAGGFTSILTAGEEATETDDLPLRARSFPDGVTALMSYYYIPSLHPTTPLALTDSGITSTQTAIFSEAEDYSTGKTTVASDPAASGGQAIILDEIEEYAEYEYAFTHDIPPGYFSVAIRARIDSFGPDPYDQLQLKINGQTSQLNFTTHIIDGYDNYQWYLGVAASGDTLSGKNLDEGDDPHTFEISKVMGDDAVYVDCIAFRDRRFAFGTGLHETVDGNGALDGPNLFPSSLPVAFDVPLVGADIDHITWTVDFNAPATGGVPGIMVPKLEDSVSGGVLIDSENTVVEIEYDVPTDETVIDASGLVYIDNYTDESRTTSPKTNTRRQVVEDVEMRIDGVERSIIADEKEFQGTALSILQDLHNHANRHFVIEHGVESGQDPRFDSFVKGDESLVAGESDDWIITGKNRDVADNGDTNTVHVIGARAPNGAYYQGIARDEQAISQLAEETPDSDNGVRSVELRDKSLTSDNDCLSKARTELQERSRLSIGGDIDTTPQLLDPGFPYQLQVFDTTDLAGEEVGYGLNYGQYYGVGSLGVTSSLESISYSESADGASTSLSFERPSALLQTIESIVETPDERPTPVRDDPPVVTAGTLPNPPEDDDGGDDGGDDGEDDDTGPAPTATFSYAPIDPEVDETIEFDAAASGDEDGTIETYEWDFGDGTTATGLETTHSYSTDGDYTVSLTVTDDDGLTDTATQTVTVGEGGTNEEIAYLDSDNPLSDADYRVGGSAGPGTHGGDHVSRPAGMPTKAEANYIVTSSTDLRSAINDAGSGDVIYIDSDIDISGFSDEYLPTNCKLVGGFCDPERTENNGRGPILYNHADAPFNRRHIISAGPIEVWGVSFEGPRAQYDTLEEKYFDPRDKPGDETDYYVSALWTYPEPDTSGSLIYGCEFRGWHVAGLEAGERTTPSDVQIERCTFMNNCMETLGYGVEQWNGHAEFNLCYFNFNRHSISGFGYDTESWVVRDSMHGPDVISHAFDMHGLRQNTDYEGNLAGKYCTLENVTIPYTEEQVRYPGSGQEGFRLRGVSEEITTVADNHFYHSNPPDPPGESGDPFWQTYPDQPNEFVNLSYSGNNYGERLEQEKGCPLNSPIKPQE
jgi:PKD repeat protein